MTGDPWLDMHNTTLIYERYPEGWEKDAHKPMMCFNVWADHGFVYKREAANGIKNMTVRKPKYLRSQQLPHRFDEDVQTYLCEMHPFVDATVLQAVKDKQNRVFWTHSFKPIADDLEVLHQTFTRRGAIRLPR